MDFSRITLYALFLFISRASPAAAAYRCEQVLDRPPAILAPLPAALPFEAADFPVSPFWSPSPGQGPELFPSWAQRQALLVVASLAEGQSFTEVMGRVAAARHSLQSVIDPNNNSNPFGIKRTSSRRQVTHLAGLDKMHFPDAQWRSLERVRFFHLARHLHRNTDANGIIEAHPPGKVFYAPDGAPILAQYYSNISYTTRDGKSWPCTTLTMTREGLFSIWHPDGAMARRILADVEERAQKLLSAKNPDEAEFAALLHGYFHAMPFSRGSAAVGRVLFAGLYAEVFGRKISLDPNIDVHALIRTREQFVAEFLKSGFRAETTLPQDPRLPPPPSAGP